uniref:Putative histone 1 n=1 Tax=Amblyomma parvum TaxID=251391 RepID=A0A023FX69_AMBPA
MSDAEVKPAAAATPKAKGRKPAAGGAKKAKKPASHPKYTEMVKKSIEALKERGGSSRQAIHKYIMGHYDVGKDSKVVNTHLKLALKRAVQTGLLKRSKGTGASGSFRLADKAAAGPKKSPAKRGPKKTGAPKPKKVAKPKAAKSPAKKASKPKAAKAAKPKTAAAKPKVAKKPKAPKKAKSPKKPKVAKKATPKKAAAKK